MIGPKRPFYKAGPVMRLEKIPADEFAAVRRRSLHALGHRARSRASARRSSTSPATCRTTCSGWRTKPGTSAAAERPAEGDARRSAPDACSGCSPSRRCCSRRSWQRLTLAQRAVLRAVVLEEGVETAVSADTRTRHRLGGASTVQTALAALIRDDLIAREADGRYVVVDSLHARVGGANDVLSASSTERVARVRGHFRQAFAAQHGALLATHRRGDVYALRFARAGDAVGVCLPRGGRRATLRMRTASPSALSSRSRPRIAPPGKTTRAVSWAPGCSGVREGRRPGWGFHWGLNWYAVKLERAGRRHRDQSGELHVRPVMAGYGYTKVIRIFRYRGRARWLCHRQR